MGESPANTVPSAAPHIASEPADKESWNATQPKFEAFLHESFGKARNAQTCVNEHPVPDVPGTLFDDLISWNGGVCAEITEGPKYSAYICNVPGCVNNKPVNIAWKGRAIFALTAEKKKPANCESHLVSYDHYRNILKAKELFKSEDDAKLLYQTRIQPFHKKASRWKRTSDGAKRSRLMHQKLFRTIAGQTHKNLGTTVSSGTDAEAVHSSIVHPEQVTMPAGSAGGITVPIAPFTPTITVPPRHGMAPQIWMAPQHRHNLAQWVF